MEAVQLAARDRARTGSGGARASRRDGYVPGVVYGKKVAARSVEVASRELSRLLREHGTAGVINLSIEGEPAPLAVLFKRIQHEPVSKEPLHLDFHAIALDEEVTVEVPLEVVGHAPGADRGGVVQLVRREVSVACLPLTIPESIAVDISGLALDTSLSAGDLVMPAEVRLVTDADETIVTCAVPAVMEEPVEEAEEEAAPVEGAEEAEGAAAKDAPAEGTGSDD